MKLGALKSAIRDLKGAPKIYVQVGGVMRVFLEVQKGSLLEQLDVAFPGGRAVETGLYLHPTGQLGKEPEWPVQQLQESQE